MLLVFPIASGPLLAPFKPSTWLFEDFDNHRLLKAHTWASVPGRRHSSDLINLNKNMGRKEALSQGLYGPAPSPRVRAEQLGAKPR